MERNAVLGVEKSLTSQFWSAREADAGTVADIVRMAAVPEVIARLLAARQVKPENVSFFMHPSFRSHLPDPYILRDMEKAAERIASAVLNGEKIGVFGDYDVDGATSGAVMVQFLTALGADVVSRIPEREEGYGPSDVAMNEFISAWVSLVVTVDCGTTAFEQLKLLTEHKIDTVVLDHHEPDVRLPDVCAVVNPKRLDEPQDNPCCQMAAVGVVFMTVIAVNRLLREKGFYANRPEPRLMDFLDLVALGTVCDVMALRGLNRLFVKTGLSVMAEKKNKGLSALSDLAKIKDKPTAYHLGFVLGPRLNACGRIGNASLGMKLLCAANEDEAYEIAARLDELNTLRRQMCEDIYKQAIGRIESGGQNDALVFVYGEGWHSGVVGIIAGKLKERYNLPALVMAQEGDELRGSGRSVEGADLGAAVLAAKEKGILIAGGGHTMAAGFSLKVEKAEEFKNFLIEYFQTHRSEIQPSVDYPVDSVIDIGAVDGRLLQMLSSMEPFGEGNPEPRFALPDVAVSSARIVGSGHVSCFLVGRNGKSRVRAIAFGAADSIIGISLLNNRGGVFHVAGYIRPDTFRGGDQAQFIIEDLASAAQL
ncbi:MAG: single-stranded-DNA-specific exonuclease RecJ [Alphaproteobacteria bacterium]|nr:single-stranded-DNA-specific exonuclease RecJ [Alphaproteobacteria bacterium]